MRDYIKTLIKGLFLIYLLYFIPTGKILYAQKNNQKINGSIPINFNSNGSNVKGWFFPAKGTGPLPTMILLHGFPGGKGDLFELGQKMMKESINVLTFNYRGTWGSEGDFTLENSLQDIQSAFEYLHQKEIISEYKVDTSQIILGGYSFGGGISLTYAANHLEMKRIFSIAGTDHGEITREYLRNEAFSKMINDAFDSYKAPEGPIRFEGHTAWQELIDNLDFYDLRLSAPKLAQKDILLIGGWDDVNVTIENHLLPLYRALKKENSQNVKFIAYQTDHSFLKVREKLAEDIIKWIIK